MRALTLLLSSAPRVRRARALSPRATVSVSALSSSCAAMAAPTPSERAQAAVLGAFTADAASTCVLQACATRGTAHGP
jgi:hypothetical protein